MEITEKIALIIPIRLTGATYEGEPRLSRICEAVPQDLFEILISDYGTPPEHRGPLDAAEAKGIRVVRHPSPHPLFSIGQARDFGVQMATSPVVIFNDIDFFGTEAMYRAIHAEAMRRRIPENLFDFFCVPVLFLTEEGTNEWLAASDAAKPFAGGLTVEALEADRFRIQSVAYGSSAMVVNRHHYLSVGGHDPRFTGHGAEDYDLLHRLATLAPKGPRPHDYFTDYKDNNVRQFWGFRPFFALYGLDLLPSGVHLVHLWHPRRMEKGYFRPGRNFRLLKRVMKRFDRSGDQPMPLAHLAGDGGKWLVVYRSERDLALLRQLLPMSAGYRAIRARSYLQAGKRLWKLQVAGLTHVLIAPSLGGNAGDLVPHLPPAARILWLQGPDESEIVAFRGKDGDIAASGTVGTISNPAGRALMTYWQEVKLPGLPRLASGVIPPAQDAGAPLFASFGREQVLVKDKKTRPVRKKKSPILTRIRRWITGY
jgi:predicted glycosyltransferase involved in capsule biosynthesis